MFNWLLNLHKCFGHKRQKVSESTPPPTREHLPHPVADYISLPISSALPQPSRAATTGTDSVRPGAEDGLAAVLRRPSSQSFQPYNALEAVRASKQDVDRPSSGKGRKRAHPESAADGQQASLEYKSVQPLLSAAQEKQQSRIRQSDAVSARPSETPSAFVHGRTTAEEVPLRRRDTPFELRVEHQLQQAGESVSGNLGEAGTGLSHLGWSSIKKVHPGNKRSSPQQRLTPKHRAALMPGEMEEEEALSPTYGNENADPGYASLRNSASSLQGVPQAAASSSGKPSLQIQLPFLTQLMASNPHTPSSPQNLRFMVDNDDSYGPPNIVGVENLHTQYREDKRLRVHDTPFEVRVERLMHKEQQYKERYLDKEA